MHRKGKEVAGNKTTAVNKAASLVPVVKPKKKRPAGGHRETIKIKVGKNIVFEHTTDKR